jgi:hypothetical protein
MQYPHLANEKYHMEAISRGNFIFRRAMFVPRRMTPPQPSGATSETPAAEGRTLAPSLPLILRGAIIVPSTTQSAVPILQCARSTTGAAGQTKASPETGHAGIRALPKQHDSMHNLLEGSRLNNVSWNRERSASYTSDYRGAKMVCVPPNWGKGYVRLWYRMRISKTGLPSLLVDETHRGRSIVGP